MARMWKDRVKLGLDCHPRQLGRQSVEARDLDAGEIVEPASAIHIPAHAVTLLVDLARRAAEIFRTPAHPESRNLIAIFGAEPAAQAGDLHLAAIFESRRHFAVRHRFAPLVESSSAAHPIISFRPVARSLLCSGPPSFGILRETPQGKGHAPWTPPNCARYKRRSRSVTGPIPRPASSRFAPKARWTKQTSPARSRRAAPSSRPACIPRPAARGLNSARATCCSKRSSPAPASP